MGGEKELVSTEERCLAEGVEKRRWPAVIVIGVAYRVRAAATGFL